MRACVPPQCLFWGHACCSKHHTRPLILAAPIVAQVNAEARRVTELLTQLPVDIDVEGLVQRALVKGLIGRSAATTLIPNPDATSASPLATAPSLTGSSAALLGPVKVQTFLSRRGVSGASTSAAGSITNASLRSAGDSQPSPFVRLAHDSAKVMQSFKGA